MFSLKQKILQAVDPWVRVPVAGLDISDHNIKYLQFKHYPKLDFELFGEVELPDGLISRGDIVQEEALAGILKKWVKRDASRLARSAVVASLPEEKSFLSLIQIPKIKREEIANAVNWEIEANVPMPLDQIYYDYEVVEPLENHADHLDVLITAFPKAVVDSYLRVLKGAGLSLLALEHESQATVRSVVNDWDSKEVRLIVDIGRQHTSFIIFTGRTINFTATIELGGKTLEENIMREMQVNQEQAETIKKEVGLNKKEKDGKVFVSMIQTVSVLADEIKKTMTFYRNHAEHLHGADPDIDTIILTGGDSSLLGLDSYLTSVFKSSVIKGDALVVPRIWKRGDPVPALPRQEISSYMTVIGLAMRGQNNAHD